MQVNPMIRQGLIVLALVVFAAGPVAAQNRVAIPSTATGGFGEANGCHSGLVPALKLPGPQTLIITAANRIRIGRTSYSVPPNGISLGPRKNVGALIGAFVPQSRVSAPGFQPVSEDLASSGIPTTSLFVVGNGPYKFVAPEAGTLFLGVKAGDVCGSSGSFSVSVTVPIKIAVNPGSASLTLHQSTSQCR
jgi:hypothetical protein